MLRFCFTFILVCLFILCKAQSAGPDKFICAGGSVEIGEGTLCTGCCAKWVQLGGQASSFSDPSSIVTSVSAPGLYQLALTHPNGNISLSLVTVTTATMKIQIFDPKVFTGAYYLIPDALKETEGAHTFVNYDSDDNDTDFDIADMDVNGGDDEFIKVRVDLNIVGTMSSIAPDIVIKESSSASGTVRYWLSEDKTAGEYHIGTPITTVQPTSSGSYFAEIWVEGLKGHSAQKSVKIFAESHDSGCKSGIASITVLDVDKIEWVGLGNGYTSDGRCNSNILDVTSYHQTGILKNYRAFVDSELPNPAFPRLKVKALVKFSTAPVRDIDIYLISLDADDPLPNSVSSNFESIMQGLDPNDGSSTSFYYTGSLTINSPYDKDNDNRGDHTLAGLFFSSGVSILPNHNFRTTVKKNQADWSSEFYLDNRPGDNHYFSIYPDYDFTQKLRNEDQFDKLDIVFKSATCTNGVGCPVIASSLCSPLVTAWVTSHVEFDRMSAATSLLDNKPFIGYIDSFNEPLVVNPSTTFPVSLKSTLYLTVKGATDLVNGDLSDIDLVSDYGDILGRFQGGKINIGSPISYLTSSLIKGNTANKIGLVGIVNLVKDDKGNNALKCKLYANTGSSSVTFDVLDITIDSRAASSYKVWINNPSGIPLTAFGSASFDNGSTVPIVLDASNGHFLIAKTDLKIPVTVIDDDSDPITTLPKTYPLSGDARKAYAEAFINIVNDGGGNLAFNTTFPFKSNLIAKGVPLEAKISHVVNGYWNILCDSKSNESKLYWVVYCLDNWQNVTQRDFDSYKEFKSGFAIAEAGLPTKESFSDIQVSKGVEWSVSYIEHQYENGLAYEEEIIAHEIGHQFGLHHGYYLDTTLCSTLVFPSGVSTQNCCVPGTPCPNMGIMSAAGSNKYFVPLHLNLLRLRENSPGK